MTGTSPNELSYLLRSISNDYCDWGISDVIFCPTLTKYLLKLLAMVFPSKQPAVYGYCFYQKTIASSFSECFVNDEQKRTSQIPQSQRSFEIDLKRSDSSVEELPLSDQQIKTTFFSVRWWQNSWLLTK